MQRRQVLKVGLSGIALACTPISVTWAGAKEDDWLYSAVDDASGQHYIYGSSVDGEETFMIDVPERCHGGCLRPGQRQVVLFARRPGTRFYVVDGDRRRLVTTVEAGADHHFYGHGVFDQAGQYLYVTANRVSDSAGLVRVYDAFDDYRWARDIPVGGIGPHEIRLMPDDKTLAIGLGGIQTHPDYGRVKLNLDTMQPALLFMNRHSGAIVTRHAPSHHQLSCRHLDVSASGIVVAGYQFEGPEWERHPLLCRVDARGQFSELALPASVTDNLQQYTASVAFSRLSNNVLVTMPRSDAVLVVDAEQGQCLARVALPDAAGVRCDGRGGFLVSSGQGGLYRVTPGRDAPEVVADIDIHWDNHLT